MAAPTPTPTTIRALSVAPLDITLHTPFGIAGGSADSARNLLITIELADGTCGYGEAAPFPPFNGETQAMAASAIDAARTTLEGGDVREWRRIAQAVRAVVGEVGSAQCAIETAILDAMTRRAHMPLWSFFGGMATTLETDMTVTTGTVAQAEADAKAILARGMRTIKVKIGSGDLKLDLERVLAIRSAAPDSPLILDGNCGYSADQALQLLALLHERGVRLALIEQPVAKDDIDGMAQVVQWGGIPVAADESAASARDVLRLATARAANVINIKLMKCGVAEALDIAAAARTAGLGLMIGGMVESSLAMSMSACFAAGQGGFNYVDLDTPLFMADSPLVGGMRYHGAQIDLSQIEAGHGVVPKR
ncbi:MAG: dipeptide epimerase [Roseiflexaceae bacterium]|nr:dipeptide epimerase [Roseiflexaceae bacterium]